MSEIELQAGPVEQPIRAIVNSDGELLFPGGELEYELAFAAMGGPETALIQLSRKWETYPVQAIIGDFGVPEPVKQMLLIDSAEHVLPIREKIVDPVQSKLARRVINQCRIVLSKDESKESKEKLKYLMQTLIRPPGKDEPGHNAELYNAEISVYDAIWYATERLDGRVLFSNFNPACDAAGYDAEPCGFAGAYQSRKSVVFQQAHRKEELWEIAHFVELMRALYDAVRDPSRPPHK